MKDLSKINFEALLKYVSNKKELSEIAEKIRILDNRADLLKKQNQYVEEHGILELVTIDDIPF